MVSSYKKLLKEWSQYHSKRECLIMNFLRNTLILILFLFPVYSFADSVDYSGGPGGNDGTPGCGGGTDPAADGRFYTPDGVRCNPGPGDAKKTPRTSQESVKHNTDQSHS